MKHDFDVIVGMVDEPGISDRDGGQWARKQIKCRYCDERRLIWIGLHPDTITAKCPVGGVRRLWKRLFVLCLLVAALAACNTAPQAGDVVEKDYRDSYTSFQGGCYNSKGIPTCQIPVYHDEEFRIRLCADDICGWAEVPESTWNELEVGDFYDRRNA